MKLEGKVALVTGGGRAMGGAQARLLAAEGAPVCVADLFVEKAQAVGGEIIKSGGRPVTGTYGSLPRDCLRRASAACGPGGASSAGPW